MWKYESQLGSMSFENAGRSLDLHDLYFPVSSKESCYDFCERPNVGKGVVLVN